MDVRSLSCTADNANDYEQEGKSTDFMTASTSVYREPTSIFGRASNANDFNRGNRDSDNVNNHVINNTLSYLYINMVDSREKRLFSKIRLERHKDRALLDSGAATSCFRKQYLVQAK